MLGNRRFAIRDRCWGIGVAGGEGRREGRGGEAMGVVLWGGEGRIRAEWVRKK